MPNPKPVNTALKEQQDLAASMAEDVANAVLKYGDKVPLAVAIGVLRIVEKELLDQ